MQTWPVIMQPPQAAARAARSRSASRSTIIGSLPPSSSSTGVSRRLARSITRRPVSGEPVTQIMSTWSTSAAPVSPAPITHLQHVRRQDALHRLDGAPHAERRQLRRLDDDRVAGQQRGDGVAEREVERRVPRADDADDAARPVGDERALAEERPRADPLRRQPARRAAREAAEVQAHAHQLADDVEARLAGLALEAVEDLAPGAAPAARRARRSARPRSRAGSAPHAGCAARARATATATAVGVVHRQLGDHASARRILHAERGRPLCDHRVGHAAHPPELSNCIR